MKSTEGYAGAGFFVSDNAAVLAAKAHNIHGVMKGEGFLLQRYSNTLRDGEFRIYLTPLTGKIHSLLHTVANPFGEMLVVDLTDAIDRTYPGDLPDVEKLVHFIQQLTIHCKPVQQHIRFGFCTRIDCFVDPKGTVSCLAAQSESDHVCSTRSLIASIEFLFHLGRVERDHHWSRCGHFCRFAQPSLSARVHRVGLLAAFQTHKIKYIQCI